MESRSEKSVLDKVLDSFKYRDIEKNKKVNFSLWKLSELRHFLKVNGSLAFQMPEKKHSYKR